MKKHFSYCNSALENLEKQPFIINNKTYQILWFGGGDLKMESELLALAGSSCNQPCIWGLVTKEEMNNYCWPDIYYSIPQRTMDQILAKCDIVKNTMRKV